MAIEIEDMPIQEALLHGPGHACAIMTFRVEGPREGWLPKVVTLLDAIESAAWRATKIQILVGMAFSLFDGTSPALDFVDPGPPNEDRLFVQIAASTPSDRICALRLVDAMLKSSGGIVEMTRELHGDSRIGFTEPFGYRDGMASILERVPDELSAKIHDDVDAAVLQRYPGVTDEKKQAKARKAFESMKGAKVLPKSREELNSAGREAKLVVRERCIEPNSGVSWVLFRQYVHNFGKFFALPDDDARDAVIGKSRNAIRNEGAGDSSTGESHIAKMQPHASKIVRRSFSFRRDGSEGMVFVAAAKTPGDLTAAMTAFGGDHLGNAMNEYVKETSGVGGFYLVPPSAAWLRERFGFTEETNPKLPPEVTAMSDAHAEAESGLLDYPILPAVLDYLAILRGNGLFVEPTMALGPPFEKLIVAVEAASAGMNVDVKIVGKATPEQVQVMDDLARLREEIQHAAEAYYLRNGRYLTIGV